MENDPAFLEGVKNHPNIICVSKFVADRLGCNAYVHTCFSEEEFFYQEKKHNYFLYLAGFGWGTGKGIDVFIQLARKFRQYEFYICGTGSDSFAEELKKVVAFDRNIKFVGEVNGQHKASILASASALIYPTHLADACPSSVIESLASGTPVIGSANGSMPELVHSSVGFVCRSLPEYMKAIINIDKIKSETCRKYALENYSDVIACKKHLLYYEKIIKDGRVA
jgi:glycosyltransferase involved in cell wall biosynthesis